MRSGGVPRSRSGANEKLEWWPGKIIAPVVAVVPDMPQKESKAHTLAPATGMTLGIGLSIMLWSFIILVVLLVGF